MGFNLKNGILCLCLIVLTLLVSFGAISAVPTEESIDNISLDSIDDNLTDENNISNVSFADENNVDNVALRLGNEFSITVYQMAFGPTWSVSPESYGADLVSVESYSDPAMDKPLSTQVRIIYHFKPTDEHYFVKLVQKDRDGHVWGEVVRSN